MHPTPFVLDTSFLVDLEHNDAGAVATLNDLVGTDVVLLVPTIAAAEFLTGLDESDAAAGDLFGAAEVRSFDLADAMAAARLAQLARARGRFPGWPDIMIAGFAKQRKAVVVTANPTHFQDVATRSY